MLKFISSVRLAVILIAALAGLSVSATVYDLPGIYQSLPFRILAVAFFINLLTCSVQLWPKVARLLKRGADSLEGQEAFLKESTLNEEEFEAILKAQRYKKNEKISGDGKYILARQHIPALFAPHILHVGLLIIIVGAFLASFAVTGQLILSPGEEQPFPTKITEKAGEGMIKVENFETTYDKKGAIDNWVTTFDLTRDGKQVADDATTSVNHPYKKNGLSIYQMAYKNMYVVHIEGAEKETGDYAVPESQRFPVGKYTVDIEPMTDEAALMYIFDENNEEMESCALKLGEKVKVDDETTIEYIQPLNSTVLEFKYSHAVPVLFVGFIFAALGSVMALLGRYGEIHAFVKNGRVSLRIVNKSPYIRRRQSQLFGIGDDLEKEVE